MLSLWQRFCFEMLFKINPDPWKYNTSQYENRKYEQTLEMLPSGSIARAIELGCAEGHFTVQLAPRVGTLIAADISRVALTRTADRCAASKLENVSFVRLDLSKDPLPGGFELIVCSEVLYYMRGRKALETVARKLFDALDPGGYLLMAHALRVADEPDRDSFNWFNLFGAKVIGETFANINFLRLVKELRTPFYRIQLFQRDRSTSITSLPIPQVTELAQSELPLPDRGLAYKFSLVFLYNQLKRLKK